ncbi:hypothetical protein QQF64_023817 [Cirrhinus molitorella]|uniref:ATP-dependent DNA helicase n=1 Tax=Cirrhinus molitorella TaxID=172907 RepID=A0ABR3NJR0_9TELE
MTYEDCENHIEAMSTSSVIVMERRPQDCWVNGYNPHLLRAWDANMDIQFILNPYSCIMYMLSYISKAEHEMSDYLKRVIKDSSHDNLSDHECMKQVMNACSKNREVSAQEAVARTCSLKLKSSSRAVIFIPTDDNAVKMSLPMKYLQSMDDDVENVWMTGLPEKYKARPNRPEFQNMCMAEFASEYRIVYGQQSKGKNVLPLQNNMGYIQKRTRGKPAVIRFGRFSQQKNPEKFYGTLLKLYLPYRTDEQLNSPKFPTYGSFYAFASVKLPGTDEVQHVCNIVNENRTAAFNISGKTLHCLLKLPGSLKPPYQGLGNSLDEIRADLSNAHIFIIDEISMVSKQLFAYVNWRLQQIKGNQKPFGGLSLLTVGDYNQLPPLGRAKPLCVYEERALDFWKDHCQVITLTQITRQRDDLAYAELLNRLRVKQKH